MVLIAGASFLFLHLQRMQEPQNLHLSSFVTWVVFGGRQSAEDMRLPAAMQNVATAFRSRTRGKTGVLGGESRSEVWCFQGLSL